MVLRIGHRGAMGYELENTLSSFKKAIELEVDIIELDVYVCKSGELVVIHDDKVDRTTNGEGYVYEMSLEDLKKLNIGEGEKIPSLEEVLNLIDKKVKVNIELKGKKTAEPVLKLIEDYVENRNWSYDDFLISSFNHQELKKFKDLNSDIKIGVLIDNDYSGLIDQFIKKLTPYSIHLPIEFVNKDIIKEIPEMGIKVFIWTVNDKENIEKIKKLNVHGIFSDFPDRI